MGIFCLTCSVGLIWRLQVTVQADCGLWLLCAGFRPRCHYSRTTSTVAAIRHHRLVCSATDSAFNGAEPDRSAVEGAAERSQDADEVSTSEAPVHSSTWASMLLELPLELAAIGSKTNPYWLRKRKRSHWWSRQTFPKASHLWLCQYLDACGAALRRNAYVHSVCNSQSLQGALCLRFLGVSCFNKLKPAPTAELLALPCRLPQNQDQSLTAYHMT